MDDTTKDILNEIDAKRQELRVRREELTKQESEARCAIAEIDKYLGQVAATKSEPIRRTRKMTAMATEKTTGAKRGRRPDPNSETSKVLAYIRGRKGVSASQVAEALNIETAKASRLIQYHRTRGSITSQGARGSMQFFASNGATA